MHDWNVIVTVYGEEYNHAARVLREMGKVDETSFYNVLAMKVDDVTAFIGALAKRMREAPALAAVISRVAPASHTFDFDSAQSFEEQAGSIAQGWLAALSGKRFHVRLHRRGFKHRLHSQDEERFLDHVLLDALAAAGAPGEIDFDDPDAIISIDTLGNRAGMALWTREELQRYPFLKVD